MDRNSIYGIIVIIAIVFIFSYLQKPSQEQLSSEQHIKDSLTLVEQNKKIQAEKPIQPIEKAVTADTLQSEEEKGTMLKNKLGDFAASGSGQKEFYTIENDLVKIVLCNKGGMVYSAELKKYKNHRKKPLILFNGDSTIFAVNFYTNQNRSISTYDLFFVPQESEKQVYVNKSDSVRHITLRINAGEGQYMDFVYGLSPDSYKLDFRINMTGMDVAMAPNTNAIDLKWEMYIPQQEKGRDNEDTYTSVNYKYYQDNVEEMPGANKDFKDYKIDNKLKWIAYKQQFFSSVLIAGDYFENGMVKTQKLVNDTNHLRLFTAETSIAIKRAEKISVPLSFYFGPNHYSTLKACGNDLEELVKLGKNIVKWVNRFLIIPVFNFLNRFISNYGIIILLLTLLIKIILLPLTYSSYLSQAKMKVLKPEIDEINAKIPADKAMERQQATMALYKKAGVNPLGGCIPMILQFPILIAMFRFFPTSIELRQQGFLWAHDLSTYDSIIEWTGNIPLLTKFYGNHISLFTLLMTITTLITIKTNSQATASTAMPGMKSMTYIMPIMFMFILNRFSAGLTYYYFLVNVITIGQNELFKLFVNEGKLLARLNENKKKPVKKSQWQERLQKMAKDKGYKLPK